MINRRIDLGNFLLLILVEKLNDLNLKSIKPKFNRKLKLQMLPWEKIKTSGIDPNLARIGNEANE